MAEAVDWNEVRRLFVEERWEPMRIVSEIPGITRMELAQHSAQGKWRVAREEHLVKTVNETVTTLGTEGHELSADALVACGKNIAKDLMRPDLVESELRKLRSKAEAYRTTVEAMNIAVRLARDVRGMRLGQPSAVQDIDATTEVTYFTKVEKREDSKPAEEKAS